MIADLWFFNLSTFGSCPDVSIASLAHNNGKGLLHLFRYILQTPSAFPDSHEYYPVISEDFDKRYGITRDSTGPPLHRAVRCAQTETQNSRSVPSWRSLSTNSLNRRFRLDRHLFLGQFFMSILHQLLRPISSFPLECSCEALFDRS